MSIQSILSYVNPFHINANEAVNLSSMPQKQWMWHLVIPNLPSAIDTGISRFIPLNIGSTIDNFKRSAQLTALCKTVNLPKKVIETQEVFFFGRKRKVPMSATYEDNVFEVVFEEREHQAVFTTFTRWIDYIENTISGSDPGLKNVITSLLGTKNNHLGSNYSDFKSYSSDMFIIMESGNGIPNNFITVKNAFPINITQSSSLDYSGNASILYTVSFAFNEYSFISRQDII
jgi:hypothetical protein